MKEPLIISIGGGKGGVGKSVVTANLGAVLSSKGLRVGFIDADLRGANAHLYLGVRRPVKGLHDFLSGRTSSLADVAFPTKVPNSWLISGASDVLQLANPRFQQKQKIIHQLKKMDADVILVDLSAGTDSQVSDFFAAFPWGIVVSDGLPSSIENAYGYLKNGVVRGFLHCAAGDKELQERIVAASDPGHPSGITTIADLLHFIESTHPAQALAMRRWLHLKKTCLVLNMVRDQGDVAVGKRFIEIVKQYLGIKLFYIGYVLFSPEMRESVKAMTPIVSQGKPRAVVDCFEAVASNLCALTKG